MIQHNQRRAHHRIWQQSCALVADKGRCFTANSAAISIVKRVTGASQQQTEAVDAAPTPVATGDESSNQTLILKVKRQEQQILRLNRQLEDIRVDLEHANQRAAAQPSSSTPVAGAEKVEEDHEQGIASDPLTEAEFRAAASKNEIGKMATLKDSVNIDAADCDGTDHIFSKTALQGFTALHHAAFGTWTFAGCHGFASSVGL